MGLDAENRCIAGAFVGYDTRLAARKRHGTYAFGAEFVGKDGRRN